MTSTQLTLLVAGIALFIVLMRVLPWGNAVRAREERKQAEAQFRATPEAALAAPDSSQDERSLRTVTHVAYGFMAWGAVGMFDQGTLPVILAFGTITLPFIVSGIIAHVRREQAAKLWLRSHYIWLIRSFWFGILWQILAFSFGLNLMVLSAAQIGALWSLYRVVRGWVSLFQLKPVPVYLGPKAAAA